MIYEKISLREIYDTRLRMIMDGCMSEFTLYAGELVAGEDMKMSNGNPLVVKSRELEL